MCTIVRNAITGRADEHRVFWDRRDAGMVAGSDEHLVTHDDMFWAQVGGPPRHRLGQDRGAPDPVTAPFHAREHLAWLESRRREIERLIAQCAHWSPWDVAPSSPAEFAHDHHRNGIREKPLSGIS